jgi:ribosomal protein L11 methyltransferase
MIEIRLTVAQDDVETALDRLLLVAPNGVHELERSDKSELVLRGAAADLPSDAAIGELVAGVLTLTRDEVTDDWAELLRGDGRPVVVASSAVIRKPWLDVVPGLINVVLADEVAFGTGLHPTTRDCAELLVTLAPAGSAFDLGCGSGVLAILAAKLGWSPVTAIDREPRAVEATRRGADFSDVSIKVDLLDILSLDLLDATMVCANVPAELHARIGACTSECVRWVLVSGVLEHESSAVLSGYARLGFVERESRISEGWVTSLLGR